MPDRRFSTLCTIPAYAAFTVAILFACSIFNATYAQEEVIRVDTNIVAVPVSVLDRGGRYISTLKREDFKVFENGIEQEITEFGTIDSPVTVLMLLERSGIIRFQLPKLVDAANAFVRQMRPDDSLIAVTFGGGTETVIKETKVKDVIKGVRIEARSEDRYGIYMHESIDEALKIMRKLPGRKAIVVFSEGNDSGKYSSAKNNLRDAVEGDATIYTIKFNTPTSPPSSIAKAKWYLDEVARRRQFMIDLATRTGGRAFQVEQIENLDAAFAEIAAEVVRQYSLGYTPAKPPAKNERRQIKVKVNQPDVVLRARKEVVFKMAK